MIMRHCHLPNFSVDLVKEKSLASLQGFLYLAPQPGLEPGTYGLTVRRSVNAHCEVYNSVPC